MPQANRGFTTLSVGLLIVFTLVLMAGTGWKSWGIERGDMLGGYRIADTITIKVDSAKIKLSR